MTSDSSHGSSPNPFLADDDERSPSAQLFRLMLLPTVVAALFFGGVYWLRVQVDAGAGTPEPTSVVQVQLLPRPDPIPLPLAPSTLSTTSSLQSPASGPTETPAMVANQMMAALPTEAPASAEPVAPSAGVQAPNQAFPNSATVEFRNALLRHIARFQRYPKAAERQRLQGTVRAVFSLTRDGKLLSAAVKTSSGESVLDQAAIDTIRRAQPLPAIPPALPDPIRIELALGFDPS